MSDTNDDSNNTIGNTMGNKFITASSQICNQDICIREARAREFALGIAKGDGICSRHRAMVVLDRDNCSYEGCGSMVIKGFVCPNHNTKKKEKKNSSKKKSVSDLQIELNQFTNKNRDNLDQYKKAYQDHNNARKFLNNNKNKLNKKEAAHYKDMLEQKKELASKHKKIMNLESRIRKKKSQEAQATTELKYTEMKNEKSKILPDDCSNVKRRKTFEIKRKKFWKCPNGDQFCHEELAEAYRMCGGPCSMTKTGREMLSRIQLAEHLKHFVTNYPKYASALDQQKVVDMAHIASCCRDIPNCFGPPCCFPIPNLALCQNLRLAIGEKRWLNTIICTTDDAYEAASYQTKSNWWHRKDEKDELGAILSHREVSVYPIMLCHGAQFSIQDSDNEALYRQVQTTTLSSGQLKAIRYLLVKSENERENKRKQLLEDSFGSYDNEEDVRLDCLKYNLEYYPPEPSGCEKRLTTLQDTNEWKRSSMWTKLSIAYHSGLYENEEDIKKDCAKYNVKYRTFRYDHRVDNTPYCRGLMFREISRKKKENEVGKEDVK